MKRLLPLIFILVVIASLFFAATAEAQLRVTQPHSGGTGKGSATGDDVGLCLKVLDDDPFTYEFGTCGSGGGGTGLATSSPVSAGNVLVYSSANGGTAFGAATSTLTVSGPFTLPTIRILGSSGAITYTGLATTSQPSSSNLLVSNGGSGVYGAATSTLTASSPLTGSFTQVGSGGSLGCQTASGSQAGCLAAADWTTFNNKVAATRALTVAGTANQISSSAGSQDLSADRTWTLSLPSHVIFPSSFQVTRASTTHATSTNQDITGLLTFNGVTGNEWTDFCTTITGSADLCDGADASGGGGGTGNVGTSSAETSTRVPFWTSTNATPALLSGGNAGFTFNNTDARLTVTNASTTAFSATTVCLTGDTCRTTWPTGGGSLTGSTGQVAYFQGANDAVGTSTITIDTQSQVGIGSTSPYAELSVDAPTGTADYFAIGSSSGQVLSVSPSAAIKFGVGSTSSSHTAMIQGNTLIESTLSEAFAVGASGTTTRALLVNNLNFGNGLGITTNTAGSGLALSVQSGNISDNLTIDAKGSGTIQIGTVSSGTITLNRLTVNSSGLQTNATAASANFAVVSGSGSTAQTSGALLFPSSSTNNIRTFFHGATGAAPAANTNYTAVFMGHAPVSEAGSGTHPLMVNLGVRGLLVTNGAGSVSTTSTLYIDGQASTTVATGGHFGLYVHNAATYLGGTTTITGAVSDNSTGTTTVEWGDQYTSNSKVCHNTKNTTGGSISFYFVGTTMVVENNRCR